MSILYGYKVTLLWRKNCYLLWIVRKLPRTVKASEGLKLTMGANCFWSCIMIIAYSCDFTRFFLLSIALVFQSNARLIQPPWSHEKVSFYGRPWKCDFITLVTSLLRYYYYSFFPLFCSFWLSSDDHNIPYCHVLCTYSTLLGISQLLSDTDVQKWPNNFFTILTVVTGKINQNK